MAFVLLSLMPAEVSAAPPDDWAWAVVRDPASPGYVITGKDRGSSSGGAVHYEHDPDLGASIVIFDGLASAGGTAHITPLTSRSDICAVEGWEPDAGDLLIFVHCYSRTGAARDVPYVVSFLQIYSASGVRGYVWANERSTASYTPDVGYSANSTGVPNTIERTGRGRYVVTMPGLGGTGGNVQVSAYGDSPRVCRTAGWDLGSGDQVIRVRCRSKDGALVDHRFTASFARDEGLKGREGPSWAYLWANRKSAALYIPVRAYREADPSGRPVITRTSTGVYSVKLPSMPLGGAAQVTAYGNGSTRCTVASIRKSGAPQRIGVRCFDADGTTATDSMFSLSFVK